MHRHTPTTIINFVEGTRVTAQKQAQSRSPYCHLMAPKAAGLAFTLATMGDQFDGLIDITLNYPDNPRHPFKDFLMRHLDLIQVRTTEHVIDESLIGDYFHNKEFKRRFQQRLNRRWAEKDEIRARWQADEAQAPPRHAVNRG